MNKKYLKHFATATFLSLSFMSLTGCANGPVPAEEKNLEISIQNNISSSNLFEDSKDSVAVLTFTQREKERSALEYTILNYKKGISKLEDLSFKLKNEENVDTEFTLPWYIGPIINMNKNDYLLSTYTNKNLLEPGFGIGDRISLYYLMHGNEHVAEGSTISKRLIEIGYYHPRDLYKEIFTKLTSYSTIEIFSMLEDLESKGILKVSDILDSDKIDKLNNIIIKELYGNYFNFENTLSTDKSNSSRINKKWTIRLDNKNVNITNEDYLVYTLSFMIMNEILDNSPKGEKLNAI